MGPRHREYSVHGCARWQRITIGSEYSRWRGPIHVGRSLHTDQLLDIVIKWIEVVVGNRPIDEIGVPQTSSMLQVSKLEVEFGEAWSLKVRVRGGAPDHLGKIVHIVLSSCRIGLMDPERSGFDQWIRHQEAAMHHLQFIVGINRAELTRI